MSHPPFPGRAREILHADPPWDCPGRLRHTGRGGGALRHCLTVTSRQLMSAERGALSAKPHRRKIELFARRRYLNRGGAVAHRAA
ncbi:MAG: hypothetical protein OXU41_06520 [Gammaproteobacteria bacterium]|nr:hypothetical protein [Gammaproteobacteria bacterium]MDD9871155.1 hypothetical protein [Gammaproteobacteria bacterium]